MCELVFIVGNIGQWLQLGAEDSGHEERHGRLLFRILGGTTPVGQRRNGCHPQQLVSSFSLDLCVSLFLPVDWCGVITIGVTQYLELFSRKIIWWAHGRHVGESKVVE